MLCASSFGTKPKAKSPQTLYLLTNKRSEYSDEIDKLNKKEDLLLARQLKVLDRQERVAQSILMKHRREAERLKEIVNDRRQQSINLRQYDKKRLMNKNTIYGEKHKANMAGVQLPPLWAVTSEPKKRSRQPREQRVQGSMMSMRALKTGVLDTQQDTLPENNTSNTIYHTARRHLGDSQELLYEGPSSNRTVHSFHTI